MLPRHQQYLPRPRSPLLPRLDRRGEEVDDERARARAGPGLLLAGLCGDLFCSGYYLSGPCCSRIWWVDRIGGRHILFIYIHIYIYILYEFYWKFCLIRFKSLNSILFSGCYICPILHNIFKLFLKINLLSLYISIQKGIWLNFTNGDKLSEKKGMFSTLVESLMAVKHAFFGRTERVVLGGVTILPSQKQARISVTFSLPGT